LSEGLIGRDLAGRGLEVIVIGQTFY